MVTATRPWRVCQWGTRGVVDKLAICVFVGYEHMYTTELCFRATINTSVFWGSRAERFISLDIIFTLEVVVKPFYYSFNHWLMFHRSFKTLTFTYPFTTTAVFICQLICLCLYLTGLLSHCVSSAHKDNAVQFSTPQCVERNHIRLITLGHKLLLTALCLLLITAHFHTT